MDRTVLKLLSHNTTQLQVLTQMCGQIMRLCGFRCPKSKILKEGGMKKESWDHLHRLKGADDDLQGQNFCDLDR